MAQCRVRVVVSSFLSSYKTTARTATLLKRTQRGLTSLLVPSWSVSFLPAVQRCAYNSPCHYKRSVLGVSIGLGTRLAYTMDPATDSPASNVPTTGHLESSSPQEVASGAQGIGAVAVDERSCDSVEGSHDKDESTGDVSVQDAGDERYAYIQRGFTSEIYKIELMNLPPFLGYKVRVPAPPTLSISTCI